jgi:hypothetical protein
MESYEIIHIKRDGSQELLKIVETPAEIQQLTETAQYAGTWINGTVKVLSNMKGKLLIRSRKKEPRITAVETVRIHNVLWSKLHISYSDTLVHIMMRDDQFVGYGPGLEVVWSAKSFSELVNHVGKEIAYQCKINYDRYLEEYGLEDKMG